jgi:hypothetical protein
MPLVPDRLSYTEMYASDFKYPSEWTLDWNSYLLNRDKLIERIHNMMEHQEDTIGLVYKQAQTLTDNFFTAKDLLENLK